MNFEHISHPQRVIFAAGLAAERVAEEVGRRQARNIMVVASQREQSIAERVCANITPARWFDDVQQHVPVSTAEAAREAAQGAGADLIVSVGGGSTTGLAKAIALTTNIPIVSIPTTYAGSEATSVWGLTDDRTKKTGTDPAVLPATVIYDATLTTTLPVGLSVASGFNSLAHCVDSLWAPNANPINQTLALEGARALAAALPAIVADPADVTARQQALYGCYLAGMSFSAAGSGLHHKICHVLGGTFDLPHAETHTVVLPHVLALNAPAVPELAGRLARALDPDAHLGEDPAGASLAVLTALRDRIGAPSQLASYGFGHADIPEAVERTLVAAPTSNPVAVTEQNITALLTAALGRVPVPEHTV